MTDFLTFLPDAQKEVVLDKGTFRSAGAGLKSGKGIYAMVLAVGAATVGKAKEGGGATGSMATTRTTVASAAKRTASHALTVAIVSMDKVPVSLLGDFAHEESSHEEGGGGEPSKVGRMFERKPSGALKLRYYSYSDHGEKAGQKVDVYTSMNPEIERFDLKVGFQFKFNIFGGDEGTRVKVGDVIEIPGWRVIQTSATDKMFRINADRSNNHWRETEMFPLCFKLGTLFAYASGGKMPPTMRSLRKSYQANLENHNDGGRALAPGEIRRIHRGPYNNQCFLLNVPISAKSLSTELVTKSGEKVWTKAVPCFEYNPSYEQTLVKLEKMSSNVPSAIDSNGACVVSREDHDLYYGSYSLVSVINPPTASADLLKEGGVPKQTYLQWLANLSVISWGHPNGFLDPNHKSPMSSPTTKPDLATGLLTNADGTVDHYEFSRQVIELGISYEKLTLLGPRIYEGPSGFDKLIQFLISHRVGFSVLMHPDVNKTGAANDNCQELPDTEEGRWKYDLTEEEQEEKRNLSGGGSFSYTHGVIKSYVDSICWHLPEYLELKAILVPRVLMAKRYELLKNDPKLSKDQCYDTANVFHQSKNGQPYTYLTAASKACSFSDFGGDYEFYALVTVTQGSNAKIQQVAEGQLAELTSYSKDPRIAATERSERIETWLEESCTWPVDYYAVNKNMMKSCRTEAKRAFERTVSKIKSKKAGTFLAELESGGKSGADEIDSPAKKGGNKRVPVLSRKSSEADEDNVTISTTVSKTTEKTNLEEVDFSFGLGSQDESGDHDSQFGSSSQQQPKVSLLNPKGHGAVKKSLIGQNGNALDSNGVKKPSGNTGSKTSEQTKPKTATSGVTGAKRKADVVPATTGRSEGVKKPRQGDHGSK